MSIVKTWPNSRTTPLHTTPNYFSVSLTLSTPSLVNSIICVSLSNCRVMSHSSGVVTRLYPEGEDTPASSSVLTWRILARVVLAASSSMVTHSSEPES